jgi:hypothetical protein
MTEHDLDVWKIDEARHQDFGCLELLALDHIRVGCVLGEKGQIELGDEFP